MSASNEVAQVNGRSDRKRLTGESIFIIVAMPHPLCRYQVWSLKLRTQVATTIRKVEASSLGTQVSGFYQWLGRAEASLGLGIQ